MAITLSRRTLLASTAAFGAGLLLPNTAQAAARAVVSGPRWDRILILIELDGGNDGLNMVIPYEVDEYQTRRPTLKYGADQFQVTLRGQAVDMTLGNASYLTNKTGVSATQPFALNPAMPHARLAWNKAAPAQGDLAIVLGVGYDQPSFSHFRSMDIWNAGTKAATPDCWLGRLYQHADVVATEPASLTAHGVLLSRYSSNPLRHDHMRYLAMSDPKQFVRSSFNLPDTATFPAGASEQFQHLLTTQHQVYLAAGKLRSAMMQPLVAVPTRYEDYRYDPQLFTREDVSFNARSSFEMRCKSIAEMIATTVNGDASERLQIPVFKVQIGGFDNHADQKVKHEDLLGQVSSAMASIRGAMIEHGLWERVMIMTYSEFGRRPEENGSKGTDHGSANSHLIMGGGVIGGFYGAQPGLSNSSTAGQRDLVSGNLVANVPYQRLYRTAADWLGLPVPVTDPLFGYDALTGCIDPTL